MDPPEEFGVAINFGSSNIGSGKIQPKVKNTIDRVTLLNHHNLKLQLQVKTLIFQIILFQMI